MSRPTPVRDADAPRPSVGSVAAPVFFLSFALLASAQPAAAQDAYAFEQPSWGLDFLHAGEPGPQATFSEIMGSGACVFDADGDGWEDLLLVNGRYDNGTLQGERDPRSQLWRNLEGKGFERVAGALNVSAWGMGCAAGDFDGDGDLDVAFSTWGSPQLWRNDGGLAFTNLTSEAGLEHPMCGDAVCFGASLAWLDYDNDGDLDLYVLNYLAWDGEGPASPLQYEGQCNLLFRNEGDGTFTEVAEEAGVADCGRNHLALAIGDHDGDGLQDIFIASDETSDTLLRNLGNGTFQDVTEAAGVGDMRGGMGAAWGDYDRDGMPDLVITHFEGEGFALYQQGPGGTFLDQAEAHGLEDTRNFVGWGAEFADLDNDGDLDLVIANGHVNVSYSAQAGYGQRTLVYRNAGGAFDNITAEAFHPAQVLRVSRGLARGDLDQDGYPDLVMVNNPDEKAEVWRSARGPRNWLALRLAGNATMDPHALGAVVEAHARGDVVEREVVAAASYLSQSSRDVHLGLGDATHVDSLVVRWPDGTSQEFTGVGANRLLRLDAGGALEELRARPLADAPAEVRADRLGPVTLEGTVLRAPGGVALATWTLDGTTTEGLAREHTFTATGTHEAVFRVEDASGHWDEAVVRVVVENIPPSPRIAAPASADRVAPVELDGSASLDPDGRVVNWTWAVEGMTHHGPVVQHTFAALGAREVRLTVRDDDGGTASATTSIEVRNLPPAARAGPDVVGNVLSTFTFDGSDSSDPDGSIVAWAWDLGDGTTAEGSAVSKGYAMAGTYVVALRVTDDDGASSTDTFAVTINAENAPPVPLPGQDRAGDRVHPVGFDGSRSYDPDGRVVAWAWDFGDGASAEGAVVQHTYASLGDFEAALTVTDDVGATATARVRVAVRNLPPRLDAGPARALDGLAPVAFAAAAWDLDGSVVAWAWDFGDGAASDAAEPLHAYAGYGHYTVRIAVTDDEGARTDALVPLWLYARPVALPGPDRESDRLTTLAFDGSASHDPDGRVVAWAWDFGDGTVAAGPVVQHRYARLGTFEVALTVTDDDGFTGRAAASVVVRNLLPTAMPSVRTLANVEQDLGYRDLGSHDPDGSVVAWAWDFGDGAAASGPEARHAYVQPGRRVARLTVTDNDGDSAAAAWTVEVVDWLRVALAMDRGAYGVLDRPRGLAEVRFADGAPVPGAALALDWAWLATGPEGSAPPVTVRLQRLEGFADPAGRLAFEAPSPWPSPLALPHAAAPTLPGTPGQEPWGHYAVAASAAWGGNAGAGSATYTVGPGLEPLAGDLAGPGTTENVQGGACGCAAVEAARVPARLRPASLVGTWRVEA